MHAHILPYTHTRPLRWSQNVKSFLSEISHYAYQIKREWNIEQNEAHILSLHAPRPLGLLGQKVKTFSFLKVVILQFKLKEMDHRATRTHPKSLRLLGKQIKTFSFLKVIMLHIKLKEWSIEQHASTYSIITHTLGPWGWVKRSKRFLLKVNMLHIKLKRDMEHRAPCQHILCPYTQPQLVDQFER